MALQSSCAKERLAEGSQEGRQGDHVMTKEWRIRIAREKLRQFVIGMFSQARNGYADRDEPQLLHQVSREAMLERFFFEHPKLKLIRGELTAEFAGMFTSLPEFPV